MKKISIKHFTKCFALTFLFLWLLLITCSVNQAQNLSSQIINQKDILVGNIDVGDGLTSSHIYCFIQDKLGYIWIGSLEGLNRYDGYNVKKYNGNSEAEKILRNKKITAIVEGEYGVLWIGTQGNGLLRFDTKVDLITSYPIGPQLPDNEGKNNVRAICLTKTGAIWLGTAQGLYHFNPDSGKFKHFDHNPDNPSSLSSPSIGSLLQDEDGVLWIGTFNGLNRYNPGSNSFTRYYSEPGYKNSLSNSSIFRIFNDSNGMLWLATRNGLTALDRKSGTFTRYFLFHRQGKSGVSKGIHIVYEDSFGVLWAGTAEGLYTLDRNTGQFVAYKFNYIKYNSLKVPLITDIFEDRSGLLWVATYGHGIFKYDRRRLKFNHYRHQPGQSGSLHGSSVSSFCQDEEGGIWIGTLDGLNLWDRQNNRFVSYFPPHQLVKDSRKLSIFSLCRGEKYLLWLATNRGLLKFDRKEKVFSIYRNNKNNPNSLSSNGITSVYYDGNGVLWVGTFSSGLNRFDPATEQVERFKADPQNPDSLSNNTIHYILGDKDGKLWIGTDNGLNHFNPAGREFKHYFADSKTPGTLSNNRILTISKGRNNVLWIGTTGGGLNRFDCKTGRFDAYTTADGLPRDIIDGVVEDNHGNIWVSCSQGISRLVPSTRAIVNYTPRDGLQGYSFSPWAYFKNDKGEIFFGGSNGFNVFLPDNMKESLYKPPVVITDFKIFNRSVTVGSDSGLSKNISYTDSVTLNYRENIFSLDFATLDYTNQDGNRYMYMMEGLHEEWLPLGKRHDLTFTGLDPGVYKLKVKGSNSDGVWNDQITTLVIVITPPYWATWWFRVLVLALLAAMLYRWYHSRMKQLTLNIRTETEMEQLFQNYNISTREAEIIRLMMKGKSNKQIEEQLFISMSTVKSHIYKIYKKLGVQNRLELIHLFQSNIK